MGMNEWLTGLGLGDDPPHHVKTGIEWLDRSLFSWDEFSPHIILCIFRGDKGVLLTSLDAAYVNLWSRL